MKTALPNQVSYNYLRLVLASVDKFERLCELLGYLHAKQEIRPIGRLHSNYYGMRTELDYSKYSLFLYPTKNWDEPLPFYFGFGIDDYSSVVKGFVATIAPSIRSTLRLYRNCVLPPTLWLPDTYQVVARRWDVYGLETIVAIDNGSDFVSGAMSLVFMLNGVIVLRMPVSRGDMKGTIERFIQTCETQCISTLSGYVMGKYSGLDPRYKKV